MHACMYTSPISFNALLVGKSRILEIGVILCDTIGVTPTKTTALPVYAWSSLS